MDQALSLLFGNLGVADEHVRNVESAIASLKVELKKEGLAGPLAKTFSADAQIRLLADTLQATRTQLEVLKDLLLKTQQAAEVAASSDPASPPQPITAQSTSTNHSAAQPPPSKIPKVATRRAIKPVAPSASAKDVSSHAHPQAQDNVHDKADKTEKTTSNRGKSSVPLKKPAPPAASASDAPSKDKPDQLDEEKPPALPPRVLKPRISTRPPTPDHTIRSSLDDKEKDKDKEKDSKDTKASPRPRTAPPKRPSSFKELGTKDRTSNNSQTPTSSGKGAGRVSKLPDTPEDRPKTIAEKRKLFEKPGSTTPRPKVKKPPAPLAKDTKTEKTADKPEKPDKDSNPPANGKRSSEPRVSSQSAKTPREPPISKAGKIEELYEIKETLGSGGFGTVKAGQEKSSGKLYAVKIVNKNVGKDVRESVLQEIKIMRKLDHPNVIRLHDVIETEKEGLCIAMDLMRGGELFDRLVTKGKYSEKDTAVVLQKVFAGLSHMHSRGVCHCDLKPENLIYESPDSDSDLKIIDFGLSCVVVPGAPIKKPTKIVGTPEYMAPEVVEVKGYTPSVDVWAMGVITYILLCGYFPFYGKTFEEIVQKIRDGRFEFPEREWAHLSDAAKDFVKKLLVKDIKKRLTSDQCLQHPWLQGVAAPEESLPDSTLRNLRAFNARRRLKKGIHAIMAARSFKRMGQKGDRTSVDSSDPSGGDVAPSDSVQHSGSSPPKPAAEATSEAASTPEQAKAPETPGRVTPTPGRDSPLPHSGSTKIDLAEECYRSVGRMKLDPGELIRIISIAVPPSL